MEAPWVSVSPKYGAKSGRKEPRPQIKRKTRVEFNIGQLAGLIKLLLHSSNLFKSLLRATITGETKREETRGKRRIMDEKDGFVKFGQRISVELLQLEKFAS